MNKLPLDLGTEDFLDARSKYYVDKTPLIKDLIEKPFRSTVLFPRAFIDEK